MEMAIWFHDLIFDVNVDDNLLQSARRFVELANKSMNAEFKTRVYDLIMATAPPRLPKTGDQEFMLDVDLSSFGPPWDSSRTTATKSPSFPPSYSPASITRPL